MNDSWSVEALRERKNPVISPEISSSWHTSGRYDTIVDAEEWAIQLKEMPGVLGVRISKHSWSVERMFEWTRPS